MRALTAALVLTAAVACTGSDAPDPAPTTTPRSQALGGTLLFTDLRGVRLALPDGTVRTIDEQALEPQGCAWTEDGRYAAWTATASDGFSVLYVHEAATGRTGRWKGRHAGVPLAGTAAGFVIVYRGVQEAPELVVVDPARVVAGGVPRVVPLPLRKAAGTLLTARGRRVLVEQPERGAAFTGGPSTVYDVSPDGRAKPLFTNPRDLPVRGAAFTADGRRLVHFTGRRIGQDRAEQWVVVRDLRTGRDLGVRTPTREGTEPFPASVVTGADGQTVLTVAFRGPDGAALATAAYVLDGTAWREVGGDGAGWAATGPTGVLATISADDGAERLVVGGRQLAEHVQCAAWVP